MTSDRTLTIELAAFITGSNELELRRLDGEMQQPLEPLSKIARDRGATSITVRVLDFYQDHSIYRVQAASLAADGRTVTAHWGSTDDSNGRQHTFAISDSDDRGPRFVVSAVPDRPGVQAPRPFESERAIPGGSTPVVNDEEKKPDAG